MPVSELPMSHLVAKIGPQQGRRYDLNVPKTIMGRHPDCQIVVEVGAVSRQHCAVSEDNGDYFLEDLKSRNGTYLNGEQVQARKRLYDGDVIRVCEVEFTFHGRERPVTGQLGTQPTGGIDTPSSVFRAVMVDDEGEGPSSTVMNRIPADQSSVGKGGAHSWSTSPEVKLTALIEIMQNLGKAVSLDDVLAKILTALFKIYLQADRGFVVLEEPGGRLVPRWTKARREETADSIRISRTICKQVMESKQAILSADAASDQRFEMSQSIADFRIRSMMCAPLIDSDGKALGVLQIDTLDQRKRFQTEDLELLVSIAQQASVSIQNAQLAEQAMRQREVERDMQLAREVQRGFLPDHKPQIDGYQFFDYYQPAEQVGGDYFDYISLPDGRLGVIVADVVGHGVAAALLMAKLSAEARFALYAEPQPAAAVTRLNERLCAMQVQRFVTMVLLVIDPKTSQGQIVLAGHMPPIHRKPDGSISEPGEEVAGLPLGITDSLGYEQLEIKIGPGDVLALYTDGINECADAHGAMYSIDRLRGHLRSGDSDPARTGQTIVEDVRRFLGKALQNDDMCLVCFGRSK
jgi:serine phosphatase RsbU (regulator of sigma subunit)/pSer/pThr/pTyr-binding forkhead associated (FHA) protein